eukprot:g47.t1
MPSQPKDSKQAELPAPPTAIRAIPNKKDSTGNLRATPWDPWDLRDFDATLETIYPAAFAMPADPPVDNNMTIEDEYELYRLMSQRNLLRLRDAMSRVSEHDFHNLLGRRFQFELDMKLSQCFDNCTTYLTELLFDITTRYFHGRILRENVKKQCDAKMAENQGALEAAETMALRDALKKTKYEGDPVAQATEVPMYYESQEDLNPDIKELVNALVKEQLTLVEAANAKQKDKMRQGYAAGSDDFAHAQADISELMQQLQKAKDQRDQAKEASGDLRDEMERLRKEGEQMKIQLKQAGIDGFDGPGGAGGGAAAGRGRGMQNASNAERAAVMRAAEMEDELQVLKRQLAEAQQENVSMKAVVASSGASSGKEGGSENDPVALRMELEKMKRQVARAEEEKATIKEKMQKEVAAAKSEAREAVRNLEAAAAGGASSGAAGKKGGAAGEYGGEAGGLSPNSAAVQSERVRELEEALRKKDKQIEKMDNRGSEKTKELDAKTEELQQLQVALEELRLRVVNLKDLLKKSGVETGALKESGLEDVIQGGHVSKSIGYDKYKSWKTWERLYQDARDRIVRMEQHRAEAWNEKEETFLKIYYSIMGERYSAEKAEALRGDPYPASPHASPRTSPSAAMKKHKSFSKLLYGKISPNMARAQYESWKEDMEWSHEEQPMQQTVTSMNMTSMNNSTMGQMGSAFEGESGTVEDDVSASGPGNVVIGSIGASPIKSPGKKDAAPASQHRYKDSSGRWVGPPVQTTSPPKPRVGSKSFVIESSKVSSKVGEDTQGRLGVKEYNTETRTVVDANRLEQSYQITQKLSPRHHLKKSAQGSATKRMRASPMKDGLGTLPEDGSGGHGGMAGSPLQRGPVVQSPKIFEIEMLPPAPDSRQSMGQGLRMLTPMQGGSSPERTRENWRDKIPPLNVTSTSHVVPEEVEALEALRDYVQSPKGASRSPLQTTYGKKPRRDDTALEQAQLHQKIVGKIERKLITTSSKADPLGLKQQAVDRAKREEVYQRAVAAVNTDGTPAEAPEMQEAAQIAAAHHIARQSLANSLAEGLLVPVAGTGTENTVRVPGHHVNVAAPSSSHFYQGAADRPPGRRVRVNGGTSTGGANSAQPSLHSTQSEFSPPRIVDPKGKTKGTIITLNNPFEMGNKPGGAGGHQQQGGASSSSRPKKDAEQAQEQQLDAVMMNREAWHPGKVIHSEQNSPRHNVAAASKWVRLEPPSYTSPHDCSPSHSRSPRRGGAAGEQGQLLPLNLHDEPAPPASIVMDNRGLSPRRTDNNSPKSSPGDGVAGAGRPPKEFPPPEGGS